MPSQFSPKPVGAPEDRPKSLQQVDVSVCILYEKFWSAYRLSIPVKVLLIISAPAFEQIVVKVCSVRMLCSARRPFRSYSNNLDSDCNVAIAKHCEAGLTFFVQTNIPFEPDLHLEQHNKIIMLPLRVTHILFRDHLRP